MKYQLIEKDMVKFRWLYIGLAIFLVAGCSSNQKEMEKEFAGESFTGIIPCADCEGIAYRISFYANSHYESSSMYIGESNEKFIEGGSWSVDSDSTLVLRNEEGTGKFIRVEDGNLRMLDLDGKEIEGQLAGRYILRNTKSHSPEGKLQRGEGTDPAVDFKAHGNEPFWGLQVDLEPGGMLSFKVISGDSIGTAVSDIQTDSVSGVQTVNTDLESRTLNVELHPIGCMDSMSGQVYDYRVLVRQNETLYSGCGGFLNGQTE